MLSTINAQRHVIKTSCYVLSLGKAEFLLNFLSYSGSQFAMLLQAWASQQIKGLSKGRIDDPSVLLDVLMDTPSNGEVVEGCLVNIERNGNVSAFATEFIRSAGHTV